MTTLKVSKSCTRCPRVMDKEVTIEEAVAIASAKPAPPHLKLTMDGTDVVTFPTLCAPCSEIVARLIGQIKAKQTKLSSLREHKPKTKAKS